MISFDASRISPNQNLDTSHANVNNTVSQLENNLVASWVKEKNIEVKDDAAKEELSRDREEARVTRPQ